MFIPSIHLYRVPSAHSIKFILRYLVPVVFGSLLLNLPKFCLFKFSFLNSTTVKLSITELRTNEFYITYYSWMRYCQPQAKAKGGLHLKRK